MTASRALDPELSTDESDGYRTRRITRADRALTEMREHLMWLQSKRSPSGHAWFETDLAREVGVTEAMEILQKHGARLIDTPADDSDGGSR